MNRKRNAGRGRYRSLFPAPHGFGGVVASESGLLEVFLPCAGSGRDAQAACIAESYPSALEENNLTRRAASLLERYFAGEEVDFRLAIDETSFTPFQAAVYGAVARIPYGETRGYGEIAREICRPLAARGVGGAMAGNPLPVIIPCHRVVGAGGALTGYSGPGGIEFKRWLLAMERGELTEKHGKKG